MTITPPTFPSKRIGIDLKRIMQEIVGASGSIELLPFGYLSLAFRLTTGDHSQIIKVTRTSESPLPVSAREVAENIREYHRRLVDIDFPVVGGVETHLFESETGTDVVLICPDCGDDVVMQFQRGGDLIALVQKLLAALEVGFGHRLSGTELKVGIDPKPENFCSRNPAEPLRCVDLTPARFRLDDGTPLVELHQPQSREEIDFAAWRNYDIRGVLLVLQGHLSVLAPAIRPSIKRLIADAADTHGVGSFFQNTLWDRFSASSAERQEAMVRALRPKDMYVAREIAGELASNGQLSTSDFHQVIRGTHYFFDGRPHSEDYKSMLLSAIG